MAANPTGAAIFGFGFFLPLPSATFLREKSQGKGAGGSIFGAFTFHIFFLPKFQNPKFEEERGIIHQVKKEEKMDGAKTWEKIERQGRG